LRYIARIITERTSHAMQLPTLLRALLLCSLPAMLFGCAGEPPAPQQVHSKAPSPVIQEPPAPLPAHQRELSGNLLGIPARAQTELALLAISPRGRPYALLANVQLTSSGDTLGFRLPFNPDTFAKHSRIELHGRAHLDGRLILRLPPQPITTADTQQLPPLRMVPAP
jgi:uncharacterized lipoprotein YbaY